MSIRGRKIFWLEFMIFSPLPPGDGLPVGFPRVIFNLGDDEAMAMTVDELLRLFEELEETKKAEFLAKAAPCPSGPGALPDEPLDDFPRYRLPIKILRPITREDAY